MADYMMNTWIMAGAVFDGMLLCVGGLVMFAAVVCVMEALKDDSNAKNKKRMDN